MVSGEALMMLVVEVHLVLVCWLTWSPTSPLLNMGAQLHCMLMVQKSRGLHTASAHALYLELRQRSND